MIAFSLQGDDWELRDAKDKPVFLFWFSRFALPSFSHVQTQKKTL